MKLIIFFLFFILLNFIYIDSIGDDWRFSSPMSFESVVSPVPKNRILQWVDTSTIINMTNPVDQKYVSQIVGINIPTNTSYLNNAELINFFSNKSSATFLGQFNCKTNMPTCIEYKFSETMNDFCMIVASVDGFDRVTLHGMDTTAGYANQIGPVIKPIHWIDVKNGSFSSTNPECGKIFKTERPEYTTLGCFDKICDNPNFAILKPNVTIDYLKICFESFSDSEYFFYSFSKCVNIGSEITRPPLSIAFSVSGVAFLDKDYDGIYNPHIDSPLPGVNVFLTTSGGQPVRTKYGFMAPTKTNEKGFYIFSNIARGAYRVKFKFEPQYSPTTKEKSDYDDYSTSKISATFSTDVFIVSNTAAGVRMTTDSDDESITTDRVLPGINGGVISSDSEEMTITLSSSDSIDGSSSENNGASSGENGDFINRKKKSILIEK
ncbi:hypothetical protein DICPUDRAFT_81954 [Dictyostelium purpureum]|uniref:SD-repeat containing protein B domain-containing protein n=1 Tax=Dictyostelium purpureum TaxID=5786 RepID=F0ZV33_DICPU|nr:uncharacterized protein DICPUDRAFT_81954 [Dictyostelium purpureum]EGC32205.1 hypothetical protein DICPUDRAFT_81954 [Dictyostelium purpureum]|eukprot:XP_003291277.1 hypothetical protein DICPUDRAFT_81954 [Dictyostelium purpureum]